MTHPLTRRQFLKTGALATTGLGLTAAYGAAPIDPAGVTAYQDGPQVWVRLAGQVLTGYRAHPTQKYPYFYPLTGPLSGLSLTAESGLPWPHHRSLFFGCDKVNGANYWQGPVASGQIVSIGLKLGAVTARSAEVLDACEWRVPGQAPILVDERQFVVTIESPRLRFIDAAIKLTAKQDVQVAKTNHSLYAIRAAADLTPTGGGTLVNSEGKTGEKGTFGIAAAWCDFSGQRRGLGDKMMEGIALLDHPGNPWSPCKWFTRDYGFMSPTPFNWLDEAGWRLAANQSITLRYRVVLHAGDAEDAGLAAIHKAWSTPPKQQGRAVPGDRRSDDAVLADRRPME